MHNACVHTSAAADVLAAPVDRVLFAGEAASNNPATSR
jgi:hypothetical protein